MDQDQILELLTRIGHQDDSEIDLADTALLLGALDLPDTDLAPYRDHLAQLVTEVSAAAVGARTVEKRVEALRKVFYQHHGYDGDRDTYDDLENANLLHVIARKKGLPVALGILCIHMAEGVGWDLMGLNFPSHFLLRLEAPPDRAILDPFDYCNSLDAAAIRARLQDMMGEGGEFDAGYFQPVPKRAILLRLQNNIKLRALQAADTDRALGVLGAMALIAPFEAPLFSEQALIYAHKGEITTAIKVLTYFLDRDHAATRSTDEDFPEIQELLKSLLARLN